MGSIAIPHFDVPTFQGGQAVAAPGAKAQFHFWRRGGTAEAVP